MNLVMRFIFILLFFNSYLSAQEIKNPPNSYISGSNWYCNTGYKRNGQKCDKVIKPENSYYSGSNWYCNTGYKRNGQKCDKVIKPENSYYSGSNWYCNTGYKRNGNECTKMTPQEAEQQRIQMAIIAAQARAANTEFYIDGEKFTLRDISRKCEVYRYSDNYGDVECRGYEFRVIERKCEAYFSGKYEKSGELECRGSDFRPIERYCSTTMYSDNYGDIDC